MVKRVSEEEYVVWLKTSRPEVDLVGPFTNMNTKTDHRCGCGSIWSASPKKVKGGRSCQSCGRKAASKTKTLSDSSYKQWLLTYRPDILSLEPYVSARKKTQHLCQVCGSQWLTSPTLVKAGGGCHECAKLQYGAYARKTTEMHAAEIQALGRDFQLIGEYHGSHHPTSYRCLCGNEWDAAPTNVLTGSGCPACAKSVKCDADVFYIWQNMGDSRGVYKSGITSGRCGDDRISHVADEAGFQPQTIIMLRAENAREIERAVLELGADPGYDSSVDGYTEFRILTDQELGEAVSIAYSMAA